MHNKVPGNSNCNSSNSHSNSSSSNNALKKKSEKSMGKISMRSLDLEDKKTAYPERVDEPDCAYYMRTGSCAYGSNCRFNHPPNIKQTSSEKSELPERVGQPECQFYMKTGTCKFGATCKYHHPRYRNVSRGLPSVNYLGLPMRQGEKECAYYMRTGSCKYGINCKFDHPQPNAFGAMPAANYGAASSAKPASSYPHGVMSWPMTRPPYVSNPRLQGSSAYFPIYFSPSQGMMPMATWNGVQAPFPSFLPPERHQQTLGTGVAYSSQQSDSSSSAVKSSEAPALVPRVAAMRLSESQTINGQKEAFPERRGQPECQYYMRTGDCKFGTSCKYHHPKERVSHSPTSRLSPIGLPLRPDQPPCTFYSRFGVCKFGPTCKFDHPMPGAAYNSSASSLSERPPLQYSNNSSVGTAAQPSSSGNPQETSVDKGQLELPEDSVGSSDQLNPDTVTMKETEAEQSGSAASNSE